MSEKISPYITLAEKYCFKKGWFVVNPISKMREIESEDMWTAILNIWEYENRNRKKKVAV